MKKVLIAVDMQKDFIDGSLGTKEAAKIVDNVAREIKKDYDFIVCIRDTHYDDYLSTNEGKHNPVVHCIEGSEGWQINKTIEDALNSRDHGSYMFINKPTFGSEKLIEVLKEADRKESIESITLVGLRTDVCVVSNALMVKAAFPQIPIKVIPDCCAGVTPKTHKATLEIMKMCQIDIEQ